MNTGNIISGVGHAALIGWAFAGPMFNRAPPPFEVTQVTAVSGEEYAAIMDAQRPEDTPTQPQEAAQPDAQPEIAAPLAPEVPQEAPALGSQVDTAPQQPAPDTSEPAVPDVAPAPLPPVPETQVQEEAPVLQTPSQDMAALVPQTSLRPKQRPSQRIAPEQVAPPEPDTAVDDVVREEAEPVESAETPVEQQEATAPEEAATEIVTEAEEAAPAEPSQTTPSAPAAPTKSLRPKTRPTRTAAAEAPATPTEPTTAPADETPEAPSDNTGTASGIEDALAAALAGTASEATPTSAPSAPSGPPLTAGEKDALRLAVQSCWNTGSLSSDALKVTVTVAFEMGEDARPQDNTIRLTDSTGGNQDAAKQAYEAARRAIIRCGARGFDLPIEKYASWRSVEMVFNPEKMRIK
ncbi:energy transducer TonB [Rhodobacteraceae bacterium KMM 6894]|nr:energy transducer TonB [Rhodobacteraceae bacterium KMM 6894]